MNEKKTPAHEVVIGRIQASVWRNQDVRGDWFSVHLIRRYQDDQGKWHSAQTLGKDDCLVAAGLLRLCWLWIVQEGTKKSDDPFSSVLNPS